MAKKVVASLQKGDSRKMTKAIKMVKSAKTNAYTFVETVIPASELNDFLKS